MDTAAQEFGHPCPTQRTRGSARVASVWRDLYLTESDADVDLSFDYISYSSTGKSKVFLRYSAWADRLALDIEPTQLKLQQVDGGVGTFPGTYSTTVAEDTWYTLRAVLDGGDLTIYWGERGGASEAVLSVSGLTMTTSARTYVRVSPNSEHGWDNIRLIADGRSTTQTFTYNDANEQLTSNVNGVTTDMTYDEWGRLEERDDGTHMATYGYRYGGKLYSVASDFPGEGNVTYEYGGDGKRRSRVAGAEETWYNYTTGFDVVSIEDDADGSSGALTMTNVVGSPTAQVSATLADMAGTTPASGTARYYATDHLGSTRSAWDASKDGVGSYEFTPYGSRYNHFGAGLTTLPGAYTGKAWDAMTGLFHFPYRHFSPNLARWTSRDPLGMVDGPNTYVYSQDSPINYNDPLGLWVGPLIKWGLIGVGAIVTCDLGNKCFDCLENARRTAQEVADRMDPTSDRQMEAFKNARFGAECGSLCGMAGEAAAEWVYKRVKSGARYR